MWLKTGKIRVLFHFFDKQRKKGSVADSAKIQGETIYYSGFLQYAAEAKCIIQKSVV